ncbi:hypothetical protein HQN90_08540 [Paenibacillus alba]|uniref:hypothetical protein n=1 Tax=Paenibacillus alba TaxID=1197127 RepID=UPI001566648C|nr:hypothetical protein [Paenibacillus alba]NQX66170.1 hypothetical protein [Paenibacillus alba]
MKYLSIGLIILSMLTQGCSTRSDPDYGSNPEIALRSYLLGCKNKDIATTMKLYGGDYSILDNWMNEKNHKKAFAAYLEESCPNLNQIKEMKKISDDKYEATVTFKNDDGTPFQVSRSDASWEEFTYNLNKKEGIFKIDELPRP